jgi:ABC-type Fe2+-enterobactin transport system substrate-binding protein
LLILAELKHAFKEDCGLDLKLDKCKIFRKGMPIEEARSIVRDTIDADQCQHTLHDMLQLHDDQESNVIQVDGITCVGVPIGSPDFVTAFVKSKTAAMVDDVRKLQVLSNGLTHFRLVKFCR